MNTKTITWDMARDLVWSKTRPDGIYIDPDYHQKYDMNNPYDETDAIDAMYYQMQNEAFLAQKQEQK